MQSSLLGQAQCASCRPTIHAIVAALKVCSTRLSLHDGKQLHAYIIEFGYGSYSLAGNTLIDMYAKCKSLDDSFHVFAHLANRDIVSWNTIIAGSILNDDHGKALQIFNQLVSEGVAPDRVTLICMIKACTGITDLKLGMQLHTCIEDNCSLFEDGRVKNTLIDMYCKCGKVDYARRVFESSANKSVVSWNAMIAGYAQHGTSELAFQMFYIMLCGCVEPNRTTCVALLKACCNSSTPQEGMLVYFITTEKGIDVDVCVVSTLIDMYCKCGTLEDAYKVFYMSASQDVVIWSALVGGLVHKGQCVEAFDLFEQMQQAGIKPNYVTYLSILKACTNMLSVDKGRQIHESIRVNGFEVVTSIGNALMDMYIKCGSLEGAHDVFDELPQRSLITWSTLVAGNVEHGFYEEALLLFRHMLREGFEPSSITLAYVFKACSSIYALAEGKLAHAYSVETSVDSDVLVANTLVCMYANCGSIEDARTTFQTPLDYDVVTWSAMIAECTDYKTALEYFKGMLEAGTRPNDLTFVGLLSACSQKGLLVEGFQHFRSMNEDYGIAASFEHYNCIIDLLGRMGRLVEADMLLLTMPFEPNLVVKTSLLSHCGSFGNTSLGKKFYQS